VSGYTTQDVARMIGVSAGRLRAYLRAGVLSPEKGTRGELRFSFQDLLLLRKAEGLVSQRISPHRVRRALKRLRERFTDAQPLTGVSLGTDGPQVVVHEGGARWQAESGQVLLAFEPQSLTETGDVRWWRCPPARWPANRRPATSCLRPPRRSTSSPAISTRPIPSAPNPATAR
jgi:DNA-binding transcriptional MerR regulator